MSEAQESVQERWKRKRHELFLSRLQTPTVRELYGDVPERGEDFLLEAERLWQEHKEGQPKRDKGEAFVDRLKRQAVIEKKKRELLKKMRETLGEDGGKKFFRYLLGVDRHTPYFWDYEKAREKGIDLLEDRDWDHTKVRSVIEELRRKGISGEGKIDEITSDKFFSLFKFMSGIDPYKFQDLISGKKRLTDAERRRIETVDDILRRAPRKEDSE